MKKIIVHTDLSQPIYEKLKAMILARVLNPGEKIIQEKIAAELGVSRTPLNKALNRLEQEMLVESIPRRGMYVKDIDLNEMLDIFHVREGLEAVAARLVAEKQDAKVMKKLRSFFAPFIANPKNIDVNKYWEADEKFHAELIKGSGNEVLGRMYFFNNLQGKITQMGLVRTPEETLADHVGIIEAIEANNPEEAAYQAAYHVRQSADLIKKAIADKKSK